LIYFTNKQIQSVSIRTQINDDALDRLCAHHTYHAQPVDNGTSEKDWDSTIDLIVRQTDDESPTGGIVALTQLAVEPWVVRIVALSSSVLGSARP